MGELEVLRVRPLGRTFNSQDESDLAAEGCLREYKRCPQGLKPVWVRTQKKKPQVPPLRCAPVEMTILLRDEFRVSRRKRSLSYNRIVISTGAQRSGEICGFSLCAIPVVAGLYISHPEDS